VYIASPRGFCLGISDTITYSFLVEEPKLGEFPQFSLCLLKSRSDFFFFLDRVFLCI
jgi:hypothetical protein